MKNFWPELKKPIAALAPLCDVTDSVFRQMVASCGKPDVMFTEFVSADGLLHPKSRDRMIQYYLRFTNAERPLIAQLWGNDPEKFREAAGLIASLGFDGIDINMGCPDKKVVGAAHAGAALILDPPRAIEIIEAARDGAPELPVSVKTRLGFDTNIAEAWVGKLLKARPVAITLHLRTAKQMSRSAADWDSARAAVEIARGSGTLILGNGDVKNRKEIAEKALQYGVDGVVVGRGIFRNPWLFNVAVDPATVPVENRLALLLSHAKLFEETFSGLKRFHMMYKHFANYVSGFPGAQELRAKLFATQSAQEVAGVLSAWLVRNVPRELQPVG